MREKIKDINRLYHIIEAIDNLIEFTRGIHFEEFQGNKILRFAVIKNLEIIGEAAYLLTNEFKQNHTDVDWKIIIGMRHVLVHGYYQISDEIVWATIQTELLPLKEKIEQYKEELEESPNH